MELSLQAPYGLWKGRHWQKYQIVSRLQISSRHPCQQMYSLKLRSWSLPLSQIWQMQNYLLCLWNWFRILRPSIWVWILPTVPSFCLIPCQMNVRNMLPATWKASPKWMERSSILVSWSLSKSSARQGSSNSVFILALIGKHSQTRWCVCMFMNGLLFLPGQRLQQYWYCCHAKTIHSNSKLARNCGAQKGRGKKSLPYRSCLKVKVLSCSAPPPNMRVTTRILKSWGDPELNLHLPEFWILGRTTRIPSLVYIR